MSLRSCEVALGVAGESRRRDGDVVDFESLCVCMVSEIKRRFWFFFLAIIFTCLNLLIDSVYDHFFNFT